MNVILIFVSTLDGKINKWDGSRVNSWTSVEDQHYFNDILTNSELIVTGSNSYLIDKPKTKEGQLMIVLTHKPELYNNYVKPNQLEFWNITPAQLVTHFEKQDLNKMIVVGGPHIATSFLKEKLIDEIWLTIEPKIFGNGPSLSIQENLDIDLQLQSIEQLNSKGTLIVKYKVV